MTKVLQHKNDFFDDYAHHPTEIRSVLQSLKKLIKKKYLFFNPIDIQD